MMRGKKAIVSIVCLTLLAGCSNGNVTGSTAASNGQYHCRTINYYDYGRPVPETSEAVDDSYFADTFFGGDSRMGSLYLYGNLREKGAQIWYCESLSLFRIYDMQNEDMYEEFGEVPLYDLLTTTQKQNIYILLGINEIRSEDFEAWGETYASLIDDIKNANPAAHIYIMNAYHPREISGLDDAQITTQVQMVNDKMQSIAKEKRVYYYNTDDGMIDESGKIREEWVWDGLHLNIEGSQVFSTEIAKHVVKEDMYVKKVCE